MNIYFFRKFFTAGNIISFLAVSFAGLCSAKDTAVLENQFKVIHDKNITFEDAAKISVNGRIPGRFKTFTMNENGIFNLKNLFPDYTPIKDCAIVCTRLISSKDDELVLGVAADYWFSCYVNGKLVLSNEPLGETGTDISELAAQNNPVSIKVKKGVNYVAIHTRPGIASWNFTCRLLNLTDIPQDDCARNAFMTKLYMQKQPQGIRRQQFMKISTTSAELAVQTYYPSSIILQYNLENSKDVKTVHNARYGLVPSKKIHHFKFRDLQPGSVYKYRLINVDEFEKVIAEGAFTTNPANGGKPQSLIAFSDTQTTYKERSKIVEAMSKHPDFQKADMFVSLGDVVSDFSNFNRVYWDSYLDIINRNSPGKRFYPVRGNHEYRGSDTDRYAEWFDQPYYAFRNGDVFYIVLDTMEDTPRIERRRYTWRQYTKEHLQAQKEWLKNIVQSEECKSAKMRIVMAHTTPFEWEKPYYAKNTAFMCKDIFFGDDPVCRIDLWLCADIHSPYRFDPVRGIMEGAKRKATETKKCELTENDRRNIRFPVYVNDGPRGAGVDFTSTLLEINGNVMTLTCRDWEGNLMDKVEITPGKPFRVIETTYVKYEPFRQ